MPLSRTLNLRPIDYGIAHAAATDAGNRSMRVAGRGCWNEADLEVAREEFRRLMPWPEAEDEPDDGDPPPDPTEVDGKDFLNDWTDR